jgi:choline dehydrogenase
VTVALIEAGQFYEYDNSPLSSTPFGDLFGVGTSASEIDPSIDWGFMTVPVPGVNDRSVHFARGKTLGGTSGKVINTFSELWLVIIGSDLST